MTRSEGFRDVLGYRAVTPAAAFASRASCAWSRGGKFRLAYARREPYVDTYESPDGPCPRRWKSVSVRFSPRCWARWIFACPADVMDSAVDYLAARILSEWAKAAAEPNAAIAPEGAPADT